MARKHRRLTAKNMADVFEAILAMDKDDRKEIAKVFDRALEDLAEDDFFGTECQCDPRGDGRNDNDF